MVAAAVIGAGGFSGQETLDRVLAHPALELLALGSDSLAGQSAEALDPRLARNGHGPLPQFVSNEEALAAGAMLVFCCLDNDFDAPEGAVVVDLSGSHRFAQDWCYALPELAPPTGRLIANPGLLRDRGAARARADEGDRRPGERGRRRQVGHLRGRPHAEGELARSGACWTTSRRTRSARTGTRRRSRSCSASRSRFVPHVVPLRRGLVCTCYVSASEDPRPLLEAAYAESHVVACRRLGSGRRAGAGHRRRRGRRLRGRATGRWIVICAIDNLGKGAAGQAVQNANLALGLEETAGLRLSGVLV